MKKLIAMVVVAAILTATFTACKKESNSKTYVGEVENETKNSSTPSETAEVDESSKVDSLSSDGKETKSSSAITSSEKVKTNTSKKSNTSGKTSSKTGLVSSKKSTAVSSSKTSVSSNTSSKKVESKVENTVKTRVLKNDKFSIEVPTSLDGKYTLDYNGIGEIDYCDCYMDLIIEEAEYSYLNAALHFVVYDYEFEGLKDAKISAKDGWYAYALIYLDGEDMAFYTPEAEQNCDALLAQKDFIISSFKWLI